MNEDEVAVNILFWQVCDEIVVFLNEIISFAVF